MFAKTSHEIARSKTRERSFDFFRNRVEDSSLGPRLVDNARNAERRLLPGSKPSDHRAATDRQGRTRARTDRHHLFAQRVGGNLVPRVRRADSGAARTGPNAPDWRPDGGLWPGGRGNRLVAAPRDRGNHDG